MSFSWDRIQRGPDGKIVLLYRHERIFKEGLHKGCAKALDVGGWGILAARLTEEGIDTTIVDIFGEDQYYPDRVRAMKHVVGDITKQDTVSKLGWSNAYELITCFEMLEHCEDQNAAVWNMYRLLRPGGVLVGTFPIPGYSHKAEEPGINWLTAEQIKDLLFACGFEDILVEPTASLEETGPKSSYYFRAVKV